MGLVESTLEEIRLALDGAGFDPPHGSVSSLPEPYLLAKESTSVEELSRINGTLVVVGDLIVTGDVDLPCLNRMANVIVTGNLKARHIYMDAFLVVGGLLEVSSLIADGRWSGGIFAGSLVADTVVLHDCGMELSDEKPRFEVKRIADFQYETEARAAIPELFDAEGSPTDLAGFFRQLDR